MAKQIDKRKRAKERIEELKGFYGHFMAYIGVNTMITVVKVVSCVSDGETLSEALFDFGTFAVWIFWGIGLFFHAVKVFGFNPFLGKGWEERQIQKYIDKESKEAEKYKEIGSGYRK